MNAHAHAHTLHFGLSHHPQLLFRRLIKSLCSVRFREVAISLLLFQHGQVGMWRGCLDESKGPPKVVPIISMTPTHSPTRTAGHCVRRYVDTSHAVSDLLSSRVQEVRPVAFIFGRKLICKSEPALVRNKIVVQCNPM